MAEFLTQSLKVGCSQSYDSQAEEQRFVSYFFPTEAGSLPKTQLLQWFSLNVSIIVILTHMDAICLWALRFITNVKSLSSQDLMYLHIEQPALAIYSLHQWYDLIYNFIFGLHPIHIYVPSLFRVAQRVMGSKVTKWHNLRHLNVVLYIQAYHLLDQ